MNDFVDDRDLEREPTTEQVPLFQRDPGQRSLADVLERTQ